METPEYMTLQFENPAIHIPSPVLRPPSSVIGHRSPVPFKSY